jgi:hypothetical protein
MRVLENRVLTRKFRPERSELRGGRRKLKYEELHRILLGG